MAYDADLTELLKKCTNEDLETLVQYIIQKGSISETLSGNELYKQNNPNHSKYVSEIIDELQCFGGDTFVNTIRGGGVKYREIVEDVAKRFNVNYSKDDTTKQIERLLIITMFKQSYKKLKEEEQKVIKDELNINIDELDNINNTKDLTDYIKNKNDIILKIATIIAVNVAMQVLGRGALTTFANIGLGRALVIFTGPIGWILSALLTLPLISGPAYRVTIPCVFHIAMLREKYGE